MKPLKLLPFLIFLTIINSNIYSQDNLPDVKPLAPNAASLFKVLERPVGTYTGTVPVDFPLCSVGSGELSASLSLSYNSTGGIRVEEGSGCVGLGFSLNDGGGRIVQSVKGQPDDGPSGLLHNVTRPSNFNCTEMNGDVYQAYYYPYQLDLDPDIFMYNFNGQSGKFFFREDGTIVMMQKTDFKIAYLSNSSGIYEWSITDNNGNYYVFDKKLSDDYTYTDLTTSTNTIGVSSNSWFLSRVQNAFVSKLITFTHQLSSDVFMSLSGGRMILPPTVGCNGFDLQTHSNVVESSVSEYLVSKITAESGFILINSSTGRSDSYGRKVDSIMLFTPDSQLVKKFRFNYGYFSAGANFGDKRLYLKSFSEFGSSGTDSITHSFDYHTEYTLPSRLSNNVDYWGFYNGFINGNLFPNYVFINGGNRYRNTSLGKRNARPDYAKAGMLKKIKYPTGGYREFIYEGNTALIAFNPNLYHPDETNSATRFFNSPSTEWNSNYGFTNPFVTKYFEVNSNDGGTNFNYFITVGSCNTQVKIYKTTTANQSTGGTLIFTFLTSSGNYSLNNGYYRIEFYRDFACSILGITATWSECTLSLGTYQSPYLTGANFNENNITVGGLRVKEIRDYDPVSNKINTTEYKYKLYSADSTKTSGLLITQPRYIVPQQASGVGCSVFAVLSSSNYPLATQGGSYVVYPEVRTVESANGWTDRIFSFAPDAPSPIFPYVPPMDNSASRGLLKQEKTYDNSGTLLKKIVTNYYSTGSQYSQQGKKVVPYWWCGVCTYDWYDHPYQSGVSPTVAYCNSYSLRGNWRDISQVIDSTFTTSGTIVNKTEYEYDTLSFGRLMLKKIKNYVTGGDIKVRTIKYPYHNNNELIYGLNSTEQTAKSTLNTMNRFVPVETVDSLRLSSGSPVILSGAKYAYTVNGLNVFLTKAKSYSAANDSIEINFSAYDGNSNLVERYKTDDVKEAYLWGYDWQYPVAKVTGSSYAAISVLVNNAVIQNPSSDAAMRTELNKIRTGLAGGLAQVTTYTYKKGIGITSMTDPKGKTTFYEYDNHGRLILIRDQNNNVIKKFDYLMVNPQ